jgi:hypothetical protein
MNARRPAAEIERFVQHWLADNLRVFPGLTNLALETDRLAAALTADARAHGISGGDIHGAVGDIDTYLTERYEQAAAAA